MNLLLYFDKGQLFLEAIFYGFPFSKELTIFLQISAQAPKMGQIRKIQELYYIRYTLITN